MIRVPARFNLFVAVMAAVVAAVGLHHLLGRIPRRRWRVATFSVLGALALADLSTNPFASVAIPEMPACYELIRQRDPDATFLEVPQYGSGGSYLSSLCGYWQSHHRGLTNVGYSGHGNLKFDNLLTWNSPFKAEFLSNPRYLTMSSMPTLGIVTQARFEDYAWLYLTVHQFRYVVVHQRPDETPEHAVYLDALKQRLAKARIQEDDATVVYDRERMPRPIGPTLMTTDGWRPGWHEKPMQVFAHEGHFAVYNPDDSQELKFAIEAKALRHPMTAQLLADGRELARWEVPADRYQLCLSEPFRLPEGIQGLTVVCDDVVRPSRRGEPALEWDEDPYSLRVGGATLVVAEPPSENDDFPVIATGNDEEQRR